jgi:glycosyltransferase involved in cell wall biosynthesis
MKTLGVFGDLPSARTGMAIVLNNLAKRLTPHFRVIYFGRFGLDKEFAQETTILSGYRYEYVPCQGGVWDRELCVRIIDHYKLDYIFTEDDWFSIGGLVAAGNFWDIPVHLLTPIDSLPIHPMAYDMFSRCDKIYVPNRSYATFNGKKRFGSVTDPIKKRVGEYIKSVYLPHGIDTKEFYPTKVDRENEFTFLWLGRLEQRKAPDVLIKAFEKVSNITDARLYIRTDWQTPIGQKYAKTIQKKNLPVTMDVATDVAHTSMNTIHNMADVFLCTAMAGGFEMGIVESAATENPAIVTDWTFMNDNIIHKKTGLLVPVESYEHPTMGGTASIAKDRMWGKPSVDGLADAMYHMYMNRHETVRMGINAREFVTERFNWDEVAKTLAKEILNND